MQIYCGFSGFHQPKIHQFQGCHEVWSSFRRPVTNETEIEQWVRGQLGKLK